MSSTQVYDDHERLVPGRAYSYQYSKTGFSKAVLSYANSGATSLFTTAEDLARWLRNLHTGEVGGKRAIELLQVQGVLNGGKTIDYALGISIGEQNGLRQISHGGADAGYRTWVGYYPEIDAGVVVLGNIASFDAGGIGRRVAEVFFASDMHAKEPAKAAEAKAADAGKTAAPVPSELGKALAGVFAIENGPLVTIAYEGARLSAQVEGQPAFALVPEGDRTFRIDIAQPDVRIVFEPGPDGAVDKAVLHQNGERAMHRVTKWEPDAQALAAYAGRYYSPELETFYTVSLDDKKLTLSQRRDRDLGLSPKEKDAFTCAEWYVGEVRFGRDPAGHVASMTVSNGRVRSLRFDRVAD
jgi:hypothetical protein